MEHHTGIVEVVCGSMFSGKTDELIRRLRRATIARQKVQVFKPAIDNRYAVKKVTSHAGSDFDALPIERAAHLLNHLNADTTVVGVDEAQFFDDEIVAIVQGLADSGEREFATEVARRFCNLCVKSGFAENYNALTGAPLRDPAYSWTASVFLLLAHEYLRDG